jgi:hypothetical protein
MPTLRLSTRPGEVLEATYAEHEWPLVVSLRERMDGGGEDALAAAGELRVIHELKALVGGGMLSPVEQERFEQTHKPMPTPRRRREVRDRRDDPPPPQVALFAGDENVESFFRIPEKARRKLLEADNAAAALAASKKMAAAGERDEEPLPDPAENRIGKFSDPDASGAPVTQRKAAIGVYPSTGTKRNGVLTAIVRAGDRGMTDEDLYEATGWDENTVRPRRNELMNDGWIEDSNRTRRTPSGRDAVVWVLTEEGQRQIAVLERASA